MGLQGSQELIRLALDAGCEVIDYDTCFCIKRTLSASVVVTIPNASYLVKELVEKVKALLGL